MMDSNQEVASENTTTMTGTLSKVGLYSKTETMNDTPLEQIILLVASSSLVLSFALSLEGALGSDYRFFVASHLTDACSLRKCQSYSKQIAMIIVDYRVSVDEVNVEKGPSVVQAIRACEKNANLKRSYVVGLTVEEDEFTQQEFHRSGADCFITRPTSIPGDKYGFNVDELKKIVAEVCQGKMETEEKDPSVAELSI